MAALNPPAWLQAGTYSARLDRLVTAGLMSPQQGTGALAIRPGVRPTPSNTGLQVTQRASPGMFVSVAAGVGYVQAQSATGGAFVVENDASYDVAITAAHATLGRRDLIVARVYDAEVTGSLNEWRMEPVTGTPSGSPTVPALPAGAIPLAVVVVNAAASSITNANITDTRLYTTALGGTIPALSSAMPTTPFEGMAAYQTDSNRPVWFNGSTWHGWSDENYLNTAQLATYLSTNGYVTQAQLDANAWQTYTPTWGASTSNPTVGNSVLQGRYFVSGKMVSLHIFMNFGSTAAYGSGLYSFTLPPITPRTPAASNAYGSGGGVALFTKASGGPDVSGGFSFLWDVGSSAWRVRMMTNTGSTVANTVPFTWAVNDDINVWLTYEAA